MYNLNLASPKSARGSQICPDKGTTQGSNARYSIEMISHQWSVSFRLVRLKGFERPFPLRAPQQNMQ